MADSTVDPPVGDFAIAVSDPALHDLQRRLRHARLAPDPGNRGWRYGVAGSYLAELVEYWRDSFDWRTQERRMNARRHTRVEIDGTPVHAMLEAGSGGPGRDVLVLVHGWPWTFWDFEPVIDRLAHPERYGDSTSEAFDVVVPSVPGFGFSSPLTELGVGPARCAELIHGLLDHLGHRSCFVHGADYGLAVALDLARQRPDRVTAIHLANGPLGGLTSDRPWAELFASIYDRSEAPREQLVAWEQTRAAHVAVHSLDPQTLAFAMHDSPVGLVAWLLERRRAWSDCDGDVERVFSKDDLLTNACLYWFTDTFVTSVRVYAELMRPSVPPPRPGPLEVPVAVSSFAADGPPGFRWDFLADAFPLAWARHHPRGGHFAPAESPAELVSDVRDLRLLKNNRTPTDQPQEAP